MSIIRPLLWGTAMLLLLTGCASMGSTEFRAGLVLHRNPDFSLQIPLGWRPARASDWTSFGANQRVLQRMNEYGKSAFQREGETNLARFAAVLISSRGSWINIEIAKNQAGIKYPSGYVLTDAEKQSLWQSFEKGLVDAARPTDKPKLSLSSMDVVDYGPNTVFRLQFKQEDLRGRNVWTALAFYGTRYLVIAAHVGIPGEPNEGIEGLDVIARSFRFE